jgi:maltoporin
MFLFFTNRLVQFAISGALLLIPLTAAAQEPSEAERLRKELRELKQQNQQNQQKTAELEERLRRLEATPQGAPSRTDDDAAAAKARKFADEQYQRSTESRDLAILAESSPLRERAQKVLQDFVDINAYFRAGFGRDGAGGPQVAFQAPGAFSKYRLGNEAETYGEITFGKNFYVPGLFDLDPKERPDGTPTGPIAHVQLTLSVYNPYQDLLTSGGTDFGLPEAWASIGNVLAAQPSMKFWAGSRYYRRQDIHISDFFFYNMSGAGGGVEDVALPFGKLALAWIGMASRSGFSDVPNPDPTNQAGFSKGNWDLRLYDVPMPLGRGEFGLTYARSDSGLDSNGISAPDSSGLAVTILHTSSKFISDDGVNKFSIQYGTGAAKSFTSGFETFTLPGGVFIRPDDRDSWRFRVTEHFTANLDEHFSIGPAFVYQRTDYKSQGGVVDWVSLGVRPIVHLNHYISVAVEGGADWVKDDQANTKGVVYKATLAPQVSLGDRFMSRPVLRAFATYAHWSDDFVGQVGGADYAAKNRGMTYGMQMEVWW